jgi:Na+/serine symporter
MESEELLRFVTKGCHVIRVIIGVILGVLLAHLPVIGERTTAVGKS